MATIGKWRTGNTNPPIVFPLDLGVDPISGDPRTIAGTDEVTLIMRNPSAVAPAAQIRDVTVLEDGPYTINGTDYDQVCYWKPEDGDFDEAGVYAVVFDITNEDEDVETVPRDSANDYQFEIDAKPGDEDA